jgi:prepilin-type N-terminal cleavage/methylation domain-containing protein
MNKSSLHAAFTLIELLVVISIIAILAGVAMPALTGAAMAGKQTAAMNSARQIVLALRMYSNDYDGAFPAKRNSYDEDITTSNDALRSLIPAYLDNEKVFTVGGSKTGASADNKMTEPADMIARGENHWTYISGLTSTSNSNWPLLVDHTNGTGYYTNREGDLGGTWKGTKAISVNTDASAHITPMLGSGDKRYLPRFDDKTKNALEVKDYMGEDAKLLEPAQ